MEITALVRITIYLVGFVAFLTVAILSESTSPLFAISSGLAIGFVLPLIDALLTHTTLLRIAWYSLCTWKQRVRISASYLYRIRIDDEYLLVKGQRFDQFQPVGGVYKTHASSSGELSRMGVLDDHLLKPDTVSAGDLRIRVRGRYLVAFVKWFESSKGRETDGWREFYEELVATGILPAEVFRHVNYDRISRIYRPLRYSEWAESKELLIADVLELLPTSSQLVELRALKANPSPNIMWATETQIRRRGAKDRSSTQTTRIAETAGWTVDA